MGKEIVQRQDTLLQKAAIEVLRFSLGRYNHLEVSVDPNVPRDGPTLFIANHGSIFDVLALMVADPRNNPKTSPIIKEALGRVPVINGILEQWRPIYVKRDGADTGPIRDINRALFEEKRAVCVAAEGTRSRSGRMEGLHPTLVKVVLNSAKKGVPVVPCGVDAYDALPPGTKFPKPTKVVVKVGAPIDLQQWASGKLSPQELTGAAQFMQDSIAALLPEEHRPSRGSSPLRESILWQNNNPRNQIKTG